MQKLNYEEVVNTIENKRRFGNLKGVEISERMLEKLGHPEKDLKIVHIAGTNGKGSVSAFLHSIFEQAGLKVGMFTSPHLVDFRERIQINGEMISQEDVERIGNELLSIDFGVYPTMFDYCLAMALLYYNEKQCDVVVLETGLGGKYDSTNACGIPDVTVIAKIGFDHMAILGNTLSQIAGEKAGILKKGTKLVMESQEKEAMDVLCDVACQKEIKDVKIIDWDQIHILPPVGKKQHFSLEHYGEFTMRMLGVHQYENAAAAVYAADYFLKMQEMPQQEILRAIKNGIDRTEWMGRMQLVCENPFYLLDGAHNGNGVDALKNSLMTLYPGEKFHFIMGVMADKDYETMIEELLPLALDFKTVTVESERALQAKQLAECIRKHGVDAGVLSDIKEALPDFSVLTEEKTVVFGSLYFIGEIEQLLREYKKSNDPGAEK